jgi:hypothetical protein
MMGQWAGKYLDTGPPCGVGHYSGDGQWWWDDDQGRWFRTTGQEEVLEVEAQDVGGVSVAASLVTALSSQYGNAYFRFVAQARSADPRWPTYATAGATFPATRPSLDVVTREVVDAADRWQAAESGVGTVMVVSVDPGLQGAVTGGI